MSSPTTSSSEGVTLAALICGVVSLFAWFLPILGLPVAIVAIVLGVMGRGRGGGGKATTGIVCGVLGVLASVANAIAGAMMMS